MKHSYMGAPARLLNDVLERLERAEQLDRTAELVASLLRRVLPPGPIEDLASGVPTAHPAHPPLTALTVGCFTGASLLDLVDGNGSGSRRLTGLGLLAAVPTILTGSSDWLSTAQAERRVGLVHAMVNGYALTLLFAGYRARAGGHQLRGATLGAIGTATLTAGGWLGGHLAYAQGVGVDTTAFQRLPDDWTDVAAVADVHPDTATPGWAGEVPVFLSRTEAGLVALAGRCTHRGGPLFEGDVDDGCVTCPWHGARFRVDDGSVVSGPAVRPATVLQVRVAGDRVQVRRAEEARALRVRPVGR